MEQSSLEFFLGEDQSLIASSVEEFARDRVAPQHEMWDHAGTHPESLWQELAELGLFGTFVPENLGGADAGFRSHVLTIEILARAGGLAGALPAAQGIVIDALVLSQSVAGRELWLERLASGEVLGAPALQEIDQGTVVTLATGSGDQVTLNGEKVLVPFPGRAGCYLVRASCEGQDLLAIVQPTATG